MTTQVVGERLLGVYKSAERASFECAAAKRKLSDQGGHLYYQGLYEGRMEAYEDVGQQLAELLEELGFDLT